MRWFEDERIKAVFFAHRGKILGPLAGFLAGLLFWAIGLFWGLVVIGLTVFGYHLGRRFDETGEGLADFVEQIFDKR